jgi:transcriptional regulator with XRE-family HTH domain
MGAVVPRWSGLEARALREAMRISIREFAAHLGVNDAAVANWEKRGALAKLRYETQQLLDVDLARLDEAGLARFHLILSRSAATSTVSAGYHPGPAHRAASQPAAIISGAAVDDGPGDRLGQEFSRADPSHNTDDDEAAGELRERLANAAAVDARAIALLANQADRIREIDRMLGARAAEAQMRGHLEALEVLRTFTILADQREALADLYADAAALAGWQCLDLGRLAASWRYHEAARGAGREGRSRAALAHAMAQQAYVLVELGEITSAVQLAEYARSVAGTAVPPLLLSWLWAVQGELHALQENTLACRQAFERARRLLPREPHDPELPYIVLSDVHLARWRGNAFAHLGDTAAITDLQEASSRLDPSFTRARAGLHVDLAGALTAAGRHAEARTALREARILAIRVGSNRQRRRVRRLESLLGAA